MISLAIPLGPACAALLVATLSATALGQSAVPSPQSSSEPSVPPAAEAAPLRMHDARVYHSATALPAGTALVVGGMDDVWSPLASAEVFDPETRLFHTVGDLQGPRFGHVATALSDSRVLIIGGAGPASPRGLTSVEVYDPATGTFSQTGRLKRPRYGHTATLLDDGRVLVTGGYVGGDATDRTSAAEIFDPATGVSTSVGRMHKARAGHTATLLEDGRVAIVGGNLTTGSAERTVEVYDPQRQRFSRPFKLGGLPNIGEAPPLDDGRVFVTAARGGAILVSPNARSSEAVVGSVDLGPQVTATLLDDGRVVVIGGPGRDPALVEVFDPTTDTFQATDPMRQTRQSQSAARLGDGTVLVVGGMMLGSECMQALDTAEIWDPTTMTSIAGDTDVECAPQEPPLPPPLPPLGAETSGGRIEMPVSAFAITVPDDWSVELADPDTDVFTAEPGSTWEALRATSPDATAACSVAVGVADVSLRKRSGTASSIDVLTPRWDPDDPGILWVPEPRIEPGDHQSSSMWPTERPRRKAEGRDHDVEYSVHCVSSAKRTYRGIAESLEFLAPAE